MNWATNIRSKIEQDAHQPLSILEDLVEDGCNFVDDFLSRFNSTQLAPTTELVKTPSRRQNSTRRTRAAIAAAQKSAKKIQQINEDVFNEEPENAEETEQPELPSKSPLRANNSPSRLPLSTNQTAKKSVKLPENTAEKVHKSPPPAVNTFHKALLDMRDDNNAELGGNKKDKQEEDEPQEILDEPQEELAEPEEKQSPVQPEGSARKQKPSTDFTAPIRGDEDEEDTIKSKNNSPPRKSLAFASLPRRSPLKKSISTAKEPKESMARASWLSQSVKGGHNVSESERSSSKRKSDRIDDETSEHTQSRKFNKSSSYEQQVNEPKTPADALALKTAEIRKRLTQVAGTQRKVNLFDLPPKEAPISLASEPIAQPLEQQTHEQASSVNAQLGDSTTPPNSPPKKRVEKSWGSGVSAHIPGAYPASDSGQQEQDQEREEPEQEEQEEAPMQTASEPEPYPEPTEDKEHEDEDADAVERSILDVHKESRDEPMDLSEITQQQRKQQEERQKADSEDKMKNKRKHTNQDNMDEDGNEADEDDQTRPAKQPNTKQQPQPKPSLTVKPLQTANKFRPRAGSTDSDKKNQFSSVLGPSVTQMGKSLNKKPSAVAVPSGSVGPGHQRMPSQASIQQAQKEAAERVAAEKEKEKEKERKAMFRKEQEMKRVQAQKEVYERQEAERRAQRDELAKRRREREEAAAAKKAQAQQERLQQQQRERERAFAARKASRAPSDDESGKNKLAISQSQRQTGGAVRPMHQRTTSATRVSNTPLHRGLRPSASNGTLGYKAMSNAHRASTAKDTKDKEPALPLPKPVPLINTNASSNTESIELPDINSEYSDSEDETPKNYELPRWAESPNLKAQLQMQSTINPDEVFGMMRPLSMDDIFGVGQATNPNRHKFRARTSSANWSGADKLTPAEELAYAERMGFHGTSSKENNGKKK